MLKALPSMKSRVLQFALHCEVNWLSAVSDTHTHSHTHTLDWNGSLYDPSGTESCNVQVRLVKYGWVFIYIYGTMVTTSCVLNAPRCVTTVPRVHLHGSPGGVFVGHRPPRDPGDPPHIYIYYIYIKKTKGNRSFTSVQMCHTHTPCLWQGGATENEVKMKMRGKWRWGDLEDEMKNYLTRTRRGERKRRRREHQHDTPGPERANPGKAREKKSGGSTDTEQDQRRGGRTKAPEPTSHSENLHTPKHATEPTYLGREERMR